MKTVRFEMYVGTKFVGSDVQGFGEIEIEEGTSKDEIEQMIEDYTRDWIFDYIDWGFNIESEGSE